MTDADAATPAPGRGGQRLYLVLFTLSGFSGLIYESIWSHYLKLLLGHAAYAQVLVLAIFMGGMALGAWLAGRAAPRIRNPLMAYALIEGLVGVLALVFHGVFTALLALVHDRLAPSLGAPGAVQAVAWALGAAVILPQSILLGMTFPCMSIGLLRRFPARPGALLAGLYAVNSLGAVAGVLASGFWLIGAVGLPGTMLTAGIMNVLLATTVWLLNRQPARLAAPAPASLPAARAPVGRFGPLMLGVALITGLSSFIYELGWIRMLSMVLGGATQAFELMLSAFLLGLAAGGWWIRRRIDAHAEPVAMLGAIQIAMGVFALASLAVYNRTFASMAWLLEGLSRTDGAYTLFLLGSHGLALATMLPATFCAGTTLPLVTAALLRRGAGEASVGGVYAANTLGAILGIAIMVHFAMPRLGLRDAMVLGAALDIGLGAALLFALAASTRAVKITAAAASILPIALTLAFVQLDPYRLGSGVFRYGRSAIPADHAILYNRDGKTATITVSRSPGGETDIMTNGKPDAGIVVPPHPGVSPDEITMVMLGALPLSLRPQARTVANIGFGSGLTTATLLSSPQLESVDTIEIEPAMVDGARHFLPMVARAFDDPRGHVRFADAKTWFAAGQRRFDVIVSEPSNPWVSGVASLFSQEFYRLVARYLNDDGLLVQWIQVYEISMPMIASIVQALGSHFPDYSIYLTTNSDIVVVAGRGTGAADLHANIFEAPELAALLARVGIRNLEDLRMQAVGSRAVLEPLFASYGAPLNSDYFPFVDQTAARARFMREEAGALVSLTDAPLPLLRLLDPSHPVPAADPTPRAQNWAVDSRRRARAALARLTDPDAGAQSLGTDLDLALERIRAPACPTAAARARWLDAAFRIAVTIGAHLTRAEAEELWLQVGAMDCVAGLDDSGRRWLELMRAVSLPDAPAIRDAAGTLLSARAEPPGTERHGYLVAAAMAAHLSTGDRAGAAQIWERHRAPDWAPGSVNVFLRLLAAHALAGTDPHR
ncbi:MAG: fused MFS/spermidine synthase [Gammaproteobacteria bacterium]